MDVQYKKVSLGDRVFDKLENDILLGSYARGSILTEARLTEELNVSRTPVHEALRQLELERLVRDTGKGYEVLSITKSDLADIMDIRLSVEGLASYYAAQNRTEEDLKKLREIVELQEFYTKEKDPDHIKQMDDAFHSTVCALCGHQVIADTLLPLHRKIQKFRRASISDAKRTNAVAPEHRAIYEAIARGDAEQARLLTAQHIMNARNSMMGEKVD